MTTIVIPHRRQLAVAIEAGSGGGGSSDDTPTGFFRAGDVVYGHVHFEFHDEKEVPGVHHRLQLWLKGYERTRITKVVTHEVTRVRTLHHNNKKKEQADETTTDRTFDLENVESEQVVFHAKLEDTRFAMARVVGNLAEIKFQGRLPQSLPSESLVLETRAGDSPSLVDIEQHQKKLLQKSNKCNRMQVAYDLMVMINKDETAETPIKIRGAKSDAVHQDDIGKLPLRAIPMQQFSIVSKLLWKQGKVSFGFRCESDTGHHHHPHAGLVLHIQLDQHECKVAVRNFKVKWIQCISFWSANDGVKVVEPTATDKIIEHEQVLVVDTINVSKKTLDGDNNHIMTMYLKPPGEGCYNTYDGTLMKIYHNLTVIAETDKPNTTNPRITKTISWYN